jgi:hypothetical protein
MLFLDYTYVPVLKKPLYCSLSLKSLSITNLSIKLSGNWQAVLVLERSFITITSPEGAATVLGAERCSVQVAFV